MKKIKVIVKRPDEKYGHVCNISNSLKNLQNTVGGYIETITFDKFVIIVNEEGKLKGLPFNMRLGSDSLVGTIIVAGIDGEEFGDLQIDFSIWKKIVEEWS